MARLGGQRLQRQQGYGENVPRRGDRANDSNHRSGDSCFSGPLPAADRAPLGPSGW